MFWVATRLMLGVRFGWPIRPEIVADHMASFVAIFLLLISVLYIYNLYDADFARPRVQTIRNIFLSLATTLLGGFLLFYLVPFPVAPKTNLLILLGFFGGLFLIWRIIFFRIFTSNFKAPLAIIGISEESEILIKEIKRNPQLGYVFAGKFESVDEALHGLNKTSIIVYENHLKSDDMIKLSKAHARVLYISEAFQNILERIPVKLMDDTIALRIMERGENGLSKLITRIMEIIFAITVIVVTLPFTLIAFFAILIEDGFPIFYGQERVGLRGEIFKIWKLRSMVKNAESDGAVWAEKKDGRITKVGKILRKTHIDEIPQMINIIAGNISLVGPRPERPEFVEKLSDKIPYYFLRHIVKPGFTGWGQIKFRYARSVMDSQEKFEYDLFYLRNKNFLLDFGIILKTIQIIFTH